MPDNLFQPLERVGIPSPGGVSSAEAPGRACNRRRKQGKQKGRSSFRDSGAAIMERPRARFCQSPAYDAGAMRRGFLAGEAAFSRARHAASIPSTSFRVTGRNGPARAAWYRFAARLGSPAFS